MPKVDVRGPDFKKLFVFDPETDTIEIKKDGKTYTVDLSHYRPKKSQHELVHAERESE